MVAHILTTVKTFDPVAFIGEGWKVLEDESDKRTEALNEVDFTKVNFENGIKYGKRWTTGKERLRFLREGGNILLGVETLLALWQEKDHTTLEWIHEEKIIYYLDFFGTIIASPHNHRFVTCLRRRDTRWYCSLSCLDCEWHDGNFSVSLTSK